MVTKSDLITVQTIRSRDLEQIEVLERSAYAILVELEVIGWCEGSWVIFRTTGKQEHLLKAKIWDVVNVAQVPVDKAKVAYTDWKMNHTQLFVR